MDNGNSKKIKFVFDIIIIITNYYFDNVGNIKCIYFNFIKH